MEAVIGSIVTLTPPGLPRWNQVFALLQRHLDFEEEVFEEEVVVVQRPVNHPDKRGGVLKQRLRGDDETASLMREQEQTQHEVAG